MDDPIAPAAPRAATPWHLWVIGAVSLLWNAFGCFDYAMTVTRNPAYIAQFPADMIDWLDGAPAWSVALWALGVWGALAGSALLLLRSRHAQFAFVLSLVGLALNQFWQVASGMPASMTTPLNLAITVVIWIVAILLLHYSRVMRVHGVLR